MLLRDSVQDPLCCKDYTEKMKNVKLENPTEEFSLLYHCYWGGLPVITWGRGKDPSITREHRKRLTNTVCWTEFKLAVPASDGAGTGFGYVTVFMGPTDGLDSWSPLLRKAVGLIGERATSAFDGQHRIRGLCYKLHEVHMLAKRD